MGRQPEKGGASRSGGVAVASRAFAAHVAHVAEAAASEMAQALALAPGEAGGGCGARQRDSGAPAAEEPVVPGVGKWAADRGDGADRRGDTDKDRHGAALAPRALLVDDMGAYPVSGERVGPAGTEVCGFFFLVDACTFSGVLGGLLGVGIRAVDIGSYWAFGLLICFAFFYVSWRFGGRNVDDG